MSTILKSVAKLPLFVWHLVAFYGVLCVLGFFQLGWSLLAFFLYRVLPEATAHRVGRRFASLLYRSCFRLTSWLGILRIDASALDALDPDEAMIIAPNHPSVVDALILISRLERLNCIMKASVLDNLFLGSAARLAGYIRNDGPKRMLRLSTEHLKNGGQLIIFPEATRTLAAPVNAFTSGFAAMARSAGVPIQAVFIETDTPYLSKGWPIMKKPRRLPMTFRVRLGGRFEIGRHDSVEGFVADLRRHFVDGLAGAPLGDLWRGTPEAGLAPARRGERPEARDDGAVTMPLNPALNPSLNPALNQSLNQSLTQSRWT